jgi:hypothetical protein
VFPQILAWFKKVSGTVVRSRAPTEGWSRAVPATVPDTFLNPNEKGVFCQ